MMSRQQRQLHRNILMLLSPEMWMEPAFQEQYAALVAIGGQMSEYCFDMDGSDLLGGLMSYANQNAYKDCKFTADEVSFTNDSHDRATVHVTISGAGGDIPSETSVIVVKYDGKWYIEQ